MQLGASCGKQHATVVRTIGKHAACDQGIMPFDAMQWSLDAALSPGSAAGQLTHHDHPVQVSLSVAQARKFLSESGDRSLTAMWTARVARTYVRARSLLYAVMISDESAQVTHARGEEALPGTAYFSHVMKF